MIVAKHGAACFRPEGLQGIPVPWAHDAVAFEAWRTGQTGFPLVDANMRELLLGPVSSPTAVGRSLRAS
jgi:deoxyribodipyrimidine photo-lyase